METDGSITCSGQIVLDCRSCGENLILLGQEADWLEELTPFKCWCGTKLTLANRRKPREAMTIQRWPRYKSRAPSKPWPTS
jgi:hypothetical protein